MWMYGSCVKSPSRLGLGQREGRTAAHLSMGPVQRSHSPQRRTPTAPLAADASRTSRFGALERGCRSAGRAQRSGISAFHWVQPVLTELRPRSLMPQANPSQGLQAGSPADEWPEVHRENARPSSHGDEQGQHGHQPRHRWTRNIWRISDKPQARITQTPAPYKTCASSPCGENLSRSRAKSSPTLPPMPARRSLPPPAEKGPPHRGNFCMNSSKTAIPWGSIANSTTGWQVRTRPNPVVARPPCR